MDYQLLCDLVFDPPELPNLLHPLIRPAPTTLASWLCLSDAVNLLTHTLCWWAAVYGVAQSRSNLAATAAGELDISDTKQKHTPILPTILGPLIH